MREFAIIDNDGQLFGLPAKTFTSLEAAEAAMKFLDDRRAEMKREAEEAESYLSTHTGWDNETASQEQQLHDAVARWAREKDRTYKIRVREVGPWNPLG